MNEFKIDDTFFKDEIDYKNLDESIYTQFAKTMAKNVDIDLAKTPLVDILTGYTRYRILQSKIDKANEVLNQYMPNYASCVKALDEIEFILKEEQPKETKELFEGTMDQLNNLSIFKEDK
jgi:hypothetical protein